MKGAPFPEEKNPEEKIAVRQFVGRCYKSLVNVESPGMKDRSSIRKRVLKGAAIIQSITSSEIACAMRNQSEHGAELKVPPDAAVPNSFQLYVAVDGIAYDCVVRWRRNDRIGVEFVGRGPKPKFHYG